MIAKGCGCLICVIIGGALLNSYRFGYGYSDAWFYGSPIVFGIIFFGGPAIYDRIKERNRIAKAIKRKLEEENANEFRQKANRTVDLCNSNRDDGDKITLQPDYKGISLQSKLWNTLNDASIPLQKLENIVTELSAKNEDK